MPGYMLRNNQAGHPVMGEIGPRRIAVFIGYAYRSVLDRSSFDSRSFSVRSPFGNRRTNGE